MAISFRRAGETQDKVQTLSPGNRRPGVQTPGRIRGSAGRGRPAASTVRRSGRDETNRLPQKPPKGGCKTGNGASSPWALSTACSIIFNQCEYEKNNAGCRVKAGGSQSSAGRMRRVFAAGHASRSRSLPPAVFLPLTERSYEVGAAYGESRRGDHASAIPRRKGGCWLRAVIASNDNASRCIRPDLRGQLDNRILPL